MTARSAVGVRSVRAGRSRPLVAIVAGGLALVGAVVADGGPWIRPFIRGACRTLAQAWLEKLSDAEPGRPPAYVQCVLVDRPGVPRQPISSLVFEVRRDATLALVQ